MPAVWRGPSESDGYTVAIAAVGIDIHPNVMVRGVKYMLLAIVLGVLLSVAPLSGAVGQESCAAIADNAERLACYNRPNRDADVQPLPNDAIVLESARLIPAVPAGRQPATLAIACVEGEPEVRFAFAGHTVSITGDIAPLTMQVDQNATTVRTMAASADNRTLRFANDRDTETFLDSLAGGTSLRVRMTPPRQRSLTVDFRIGEVLPAIAELREKCGPDAS